MISREYEDRAVISANKAPGVEIFEDEDHLYHVLLSKRENDPVKKEYVNREVIQSFNKTEWQHMMDPEVQFAKSYDEVTILHDPTGPKSTPKVAGSAASKKEQDKAAEKALKEVDDLRAEYLKLYEAVAPEQATAIELKAWIDEAKARLVIQKKESEAYAKEQKKLRADYKKKYGVDVDESATNAEIEELLKTPPANIGGTGSDAEGF